MDFEVNTKLDFLTYIQITEDIVSNHFDSDGDYCPHIGEAYAMQMFYEHCVDCEELDEKLKNAKNSIEYIDILADSKTFMDSFEKNIYPNRAGIDFGNAYSHAREIIKDKRQSVTRIIDSLSKTLSKMNKELAPALSEENLAAIRAITENLTGGKSVAEAIVSEYAKSDAFKRAIGKEE